MTNTDLVNIMKDALSGSPMDAIKEIETNLELTKWKDKNLGNLIEYAHLVKKAVKGKDESEDKGSSKKILKRVKTYSKNPAMLRRLMNLINEMYAASPTELHKEIGAKMVEFGGEPTDFKGFLDFAGTYNPLKAVNSYELAGIELADEIDKNIRGQRIKGLKVIFKNGNDLWVSGPYMPSSIFDIFPPSNKYVQKAVEEAEKKKIMTSKDLMKEKNDLANKIYSVSIDEIINKPEMKDAIRSYTKKHQVDNIIDMLEKLKYVKENLNYLYLMDVNELKNDLLEKKSEVDPGGQALKYFREAEKTEFIPEHISKIVKFLDGNEWKTEKETASMWDDLIFYEKLTRKFSYKKLLGGFINDIEAYSRLAETNPENIFVKDIGLPDAIGISRILQRQGSDMTRFELLGLLNTNLLKVREAVNRNDFAKYDAEEFDGMVNEIFPHYMGEKQGLRMPELKYLSKDSKNNLRLMMATRYFSKGKLFSESSDFYTSRDNRLFNERVDDFFADGRKLKYVSGLDNKDVKNLSWLKKKSHSPIEKFDVEGIYVGEFVSRINADKSLFPEIEEDIKDMEKALKINLYDKEIVDIIRNVKLEDGTDALKYILSLKTSRDTNAIYRAIEEVNNDPRFIDKMDVAGFKGTYNVVSRRKHLTPEEYDRLEPYLDLKTVLRGKKLYDDEKEALLKASNMKTVLGVDKENGVISISSKNFRLYEDSIIEGNMGERKFRYLGKNLDIIVEKVSDMEKIGIELIGQASFVAHSNDKVWEHYGVKRKFSGDAKLNENTYVSTDGKNFINGVYLDLRLKFKYNEDILKGKENLLEDFKDSDIHREFSFVVKGTDFNYKDKFMESFPYLRWDSLKEGWIGKTVMGRLSKAEIGMITNVLGENFKGAYVEIKR